MHEKTTRSNHNCKIVNKNIKNAQLNNQVNNKMSGK